MNVRWRLLFLLLWACPDPGMGGVLPVFQLLGDTFGESATEQPHQEE